MFINLFNKTYSGRIYSIARVLKCSGHNLYQVKCENESFSVYTHEKLNSGDWIRFIGTKQMEIFNLEYVEILYNTDINLLKKCILSLKGLR